MKFRKMVKKMGIQECHVWKKRESGGSCQKALNLLSIVRIYFPFLPLVKNFFLLNI